MATAIKAGRTDRCPEETENLADSQVCLCALRNQTESEPWISSVSRPNKGRPRQATRETTVPGRFHQLPSDYAFHTCMQ